MSRKPTKKTGPAGKQPTKPAAPATKPALEGYSQEEAARRVGCSQSTVGRAIARGDIEPLTNGRLPESAIDKLKELRAADAAASEVTSDLERRLLAAQASEREAKAMLRKLELERETGRFVELDAVERSGADAAERILGVLRAMPQRVALALECACRTGAVVESKIREEVERAIGEMRNSLYLQARAADPPEGASER